MTHENNPHYPNKRFAYMCMYTLEELENMLYSQKEGEDLELIMEVLAEREAWEEKQSKKKRQVM